MVMKVAHSNSEAVDLGRVVGDHLVLTWEELMMLEVVVALVDALADLRQKGAGLPQKEVHETEVTAHSRNLHCVMVEVRQPGVKEGHVEVHLGKVIGVA